MTKKYYLKQEAFIEPLINQWYAWLYMVAPHTLGMIVRNLHFKIMDSYLEMPEMHQKAVRDPNLIGGPWIDVPGNQSAAISQLKERTRRENQNVLALADAIITMEKMLIEEGRGLNMKSLYQRMPGPLRGYQEIGYDLNNMPSSRFMERMLYQSEYYQPERQSLVLSSLQRDSRPFCLSTPRLDTGKNLHYDISFDNEAIDRLFRMKETPGSLDLVEDFLPEFREQEKLYLDMFTEDAPTLGGRDRQDLGDQVRVRYYGHACILVENKDVSILTDPIVSYKAFDHKAPRFTVADLPEKIDYVIITHGHQDHIMWETLLQLRHKIGCIVVPKTNGTIMDPSMKLALEYTGFKNVIEVEEMDQIQVPGGRITAIPFLGEHGELHIRGKMCYYISLNNKNVAAIADANNLVPEMFQYARKQLGPADIMFLGMECDGAPMSWLYGPLAARPIAHEQDQDRRLNSSDCDGGLAVIDAFDAKQAYIYAIAMEPWLGYLVPTAWSEDSRPIIEARRLIAEMKRRGRQADIPYCRGEWYL